MDDLNYMEANVMDTVYEEYEDTVDDINESEEIEEEDDEEDFEEDEEGDLKVENLEKLTSSLNLDSLNKVVKKGKKLLEKKLKLSYNEITDKELYLSDWGDLREVNRLIELLEHEIDDVKNIAKTLNEESHKVVVQKKAKDIVDKLKADNEKKDEEVEESKEPKETEKE
jgi:hypothetical protein